MTTSLHPAGTLPVSTASGTASPLARPLLGHAILLGVAGDALLRDGPTGLGFPAWIALVSLAMVALAWRDEQPIPRETRWWLATAVLFALAMAWRNAEILQFFNAVASLGALLMAAVSLARPEAALLAPRLRDTIQAALAVVRSTIIGILPLALQTAFAAPGADADGERGWPRVRAAVVAIALVLVFGALLRGADPIFASIVAIPEFDMGDLLSHVLLIGFFAWVTGGWARGALAPRPSRPGSLHIPFALGRLDVTAALGALNVLFTLFVLTQLGWLFGGEGFLRERTGLTAAQYARQGFFQMVWVVLLVVPMLLVSRAALQPGYALARRHTLLSLPLIALLGLMIVSAMGRMRLYVHYYGLSIDRVYPMVFMGWLFLVLLWLAVTVLRDWDRPFVAGAAISALVTLAGLNVVSPDRLVARANLARGAGTLTADGYRSDRAYLASLGGESLSFAIRAAVAPIVSGPATPARTAEELDRCHAASRLLDEWGPTSRRAVRRDDAGAWRQWNAGEAEAVRQVGARSRMLRMAMHESCKPRRPAPRA